MSDKNYKKISISYCFGAYDEEKVIIDTIHKLDEKLSSICGKNNYEILIVENGSSDRTPIMLKNLHNKNVTSIFIGEKNHGTALRTAIEKAKYDHVIITGADLPFGFSDLDIALTIWDKFDLVFGSKAHPDSIYPALFQRKIASLIYRSLLKLLFKLNIRDTQGSIFLHRSKILPILKYCNAKNAFFTSQIAIYAALNNLTMKEIPIKSKSIKNNKRKSKYNIIKDGLNMLRSLIMEYFKIKKYK